MKIDAETISRFAQRYADNLCPEGAEWPYSHLFFVSHIPDESRNSISHAGLDDAEKALIFIDNASAGLAKSCLLVTGTEILYSLPYRATDERRVKGSFPLSDLDTMDFIDAGSAVDVNLNGKHVGMIASMDEEELDIMKDFFKKMFRKELGRVMDEAEADKTASGPPALSPDDPQIIDQLRAYERHQQAFCLQCGYDGLMGVEKRWLPWYMTWWVIFPMLISSVGLVPGIALWLNRSSALKFNVKCPNCNTQLQTV